MSSPESERRGSARIKVQVPVEIYPEGSAAPLRGATSDLSLSGCYIESIFPFPVGTRLDLKLQLKGTLLATATVVTSDPQVGNGIRFSRMLPEDIEELRTFLENAEKTQ
jgi:c-di-GMP-binding flagellar brake protein YcgR